MLIWRITLNHLPSKILHRLRHQHLYGTQTRILDYTLSLLIYIKSDNVAKLCITQQRNYKRTIANRTKGRQSYRVENIRKFRGDGIRLNQILAEHLSQRFSINNRTVLVADEIEFDQLVTEVKACVTHHLTPASG